MKKILKNIVASIFFILSTISFAGTIDPNIQDEKYIEYAKDFKCIYQICGTYNDGTLFCASAVAIDPHWIITAAHVVKDNRLCFVNKNDKSYNIKEIIIHKDFERDGFGIADIALGYVEEDLGLDFYPSLYDQNDEVSKLCSISGYGFTGTFNTGSIKNDNKQRAGSNKIDYIDRDFLICSPSINKDKTLLEFLIASGDSGGGLFIDGKLAGINSCVMASGKKPNSSYGDESGHTRISKFVPWIKDIIEKRKKKSPF